MPAQTLERPVDVEQELGLGGDGGGLLVERHALDVRAPALGRRAGAREVDQHLAHGARRDGQEVAAVAHVEPALLGELEVGLVHEAGGVERLAGAVAPEVAVGDAPELVVDERHEAVESAGLAVAHRLQQERDLSHRHPTPPSSTVREEPMVPAWRARARSEPEPGRESHPATSAIV